MTNKILALKYRPQEFKDLIGQEVMAKTITNAIKLGKTPNAYLLTGIRGVGKTTTARLIAKALNCKKNFSEGEKCKTNESCHCQEIVTSNHIDVLEMDAASKTGIDDIRELIENSKYSPTNAKFKIFIIDEVHMLSKQAFNGLLKTLEEPPPSLKFILATTEVKKIPVTILSRCQRFDLKRVNADEIFKHLQEISKKEKGNISSKALRIISQVSEGSVRDSISLLDRALIYQNVNSKNEIDGPDIRNMLGLADKSKVINLLQEIFSGNSSKAINILKELFLNGLDAKYFLNDVLEILSLINRKLSLGSIENDKMLPEEEINLINEISEGISIDDVGLFWQFTIKTIDDLKIVNDEEITLEMYVMQLLHLKGMKASLVNDTTEITIDSDNLKKEISKEDEGYKENNTLKVKSQLKNTDQIKTNLVEQPKLKNEKSIKLKINSFEDIVKLANQENEIELKYDLERNVKLVSFRNGTIDISFNEKLNKNFIKILTEKLYVWTGDRWIISLNKKIGEKTIFEKKNETKNNQINEAKKNEKIRMLLETFDDADLIDVEKEDN
ncbi:DNA polymerase III subunit gamma/tau [Pelagibacteraceae bacterium]|nr:DNA polymerase III subunit gamma/tau [Pelagibacteraceae bacterium]